MRRVAKLVSVVGLVGVLAGVGAGAAHAAPGDAGAGVASNLESSSVPAITVPDGLNQVVADVLGLGYEQVIRLNGSRVEIVDPAPRGGAVLKSFEAGTSPVWPRDSSGRVLFHGTANLEKAGQEASRIAVLGDSIYVSVVHTHRGEQAAGSSVLKYSPDGELDETRSRTFDAREAVTSLDAYQHGDTGLLAIGLNRGGVRIAYVDKPGLPDYKVVHKWWGYLNAWTGGEQVLVAKLGTDGTGRLLLVSSLATDHMPVVIATDLTTGPDIWYMRISQIGALDWANVISFGKFGPDGSQQVAIGWPNSGRVSFLDAATGTERATIDNGPASVVRFYTNENGDNRVAIRANTALIGGIDENGTLTRIAEGPAADLPWLIQNH